MDMYKFKYDYYILFIRFYFISQNFSKIPLMQIYFDKR
jgi:hypothetical protein